MRKHLLFIFLFLTISAAGQNISVAYDHTSGTFKFQDGGNYAVVQMQGTQKENHDRVMTNLTAVCTNAKDNVTSFNDASISMSAVAKLFTLDLGMIDQTWSGNVKVEIGIKDGKIRVGAPVITQVYTDGEPITPYGGSFKSWADWYIYKSEKKTAKHGYAIKQLDDNMTALINSIIKTGGDDW